MASVGGSAAEFGGGDVEALFRHAFSEHSAGRLQAAQGLYLRVLELDPRHVHALHFLGVTALQTRRFDAALKFFSAALVLDTRIPDLHANFACALTAVGRFAEALASYDQAVALNPAFTGAWVNRGNLLLDLRRHAEALASFDRALALDAGLGAVHLHRADALLRLGSPDDALAACALARGLGPPTALLYLTEGNALLDLGRASEAIAAFERALANDPHYATAHYNRGVACSLLDRNEEALESVERALELHRRRDSSLENVVNVRATRCRLLAKLDRHEEAVAAYAALAATSPDQPLIQGDALFEKLRHADWSGYEATVATVVDAVVHRGRAENPHAFLLICDSAAAQLACARRFAAQAVTPAAGPRPRGLRKRGRLALAYVSADFRNHATAQLTARLFELHDRSRFEVIGVSLGPDTPGPMRTRLGAAFDEFIDARHRSAAQIAADLRARGVDIAIDLNGYTGAARPAIFAHRAAPIQVNFLGYPGTMGADWMDYLIADRIVVPESERRHYQEAVVWLPGSYQVNDSLRPHPEHHASRAELGLPASAVVFCCFNGVQKLTPQVYTLWMRVLQAVPDSVLWLLEEHHDAAQRLRAAAARRGVAPERIVFAPRVTHLEHLAHQPAADLFLDTLPCNAHTTCSEALWMGLPVLTQLGGAFAGRVAASLLSALGLPELIAADAGDYERRAIELALDRNRLSLLRSRLQAARTTSSLFDTARYCRTLESAYETMAARHEACQQPQDIVVVES